MPAPASNFVHLFFKKDQKKLWLITLVTKLFRVGIGSAIGNWIFDRRCWIAATASDYDREKLQERLATMAGGVTVIRAEAATQAVVTELPEPKKKAAPPVHEDFE